MRIVVFGNFAPWLINFRGPLLEEMVRRGGTVFACAPHASESIRLKLSEMGINYVHIPLLRDRLNFLHDIKTMVRFYRFLLRIKPDVVFLYTIKPVIYGSIMARIAGVGRIVSMIEGLGYVYVESTGRKRWVRHLVNVLYKISLKFNSSTIFLNHNDLEYFVQKGILPAIKGVVLNGTGVDLDYFVVEPLPKQVSFVMISRLISEKGVFEFIKAAELIKKEYSDIQFYLVGWLDENPSSITQKDLDFFVSKKMVNYLGRLDDVRPAIKNASVFVLPSWYKEGFPRTIQEAMSMGRPVITTDIPGCRDAVVHGVNGYIIPAKSITALVNAMKKFIKDPERATRMGQQGRLSAISEFDKSLVAHKILDVINL